MNECIIKTIKDLAPDVFRQRLLIDSGISIYVWEDAARAHGEWFGEIRPACTFVEVSGFIRDDWLVEVEADCVVLDAVG